MAWWRKCAWGLVIACVGCSGNGSDEGTGTGGGGGSGGASGPTIVGAWFDCGTETKDSGIEFDAAGSFAVIDSGKSVAADGTYCTRVTTSWSGSYSWDGKQLSITGSYAPSPGYSETHDGTFEVECMASCTAQASFPDVTDDTFDDYIMGELRLGRWCKSTRTSAGECPASN